LPVKVHGGWGKGRRPKENALPLQNPSGGKKLNYGRKGEKCFRGAYWELKGERYGGQGGLAILRELSAGSVDRGGGAMSEWSWGEVGRTMWVTPGDPGLKSDFQGTPTQLFSSVRGGLLPRRLYVVSGHGLQTCRGT